MTVTQEKTGIFTGLKKTRDALRRRFLSLFGGGVPRDLSEILERFEEALLLSDISPSVCATLLDRVRAQRQGKPEGEGAFDECRSLLHAGMESALRDAAISQDGWPEASPAVFFFVGSHGVGKTTTVGRMAHRFRSEGRRVLLAGSDTHRAAAGEQIAVWAERTGSDLVAQQEGADAAAVVHDALKAALSRASDVVLVDTAGCLHTERNPMENLRKMFRVAGRVVPGTPHRNYLVIDAMTGQNGLRQATEFGAIAKLSGIVLTKLDGTARGGIALSIHSDLGIPISYVGVGEEPADLIEFEPSRYVEALLAAIPRQDEVGGGLRS